MIRRHHATIGRDPFLTKFMIGGDIPQGLPASRLWLEDVIYDDDDVVERASFPLHDEGNDVPKATSMYKTESEADSNAPLDEYREV